MMFPRLPLLVAASLLMAGAAAAQTPTGYHLGASVVLPDSLLEVYAGGRFRAIVRRLARSSKERELLAVAERLYPDRQQLLAAAPEQTERGDRAVAAADTSHTRPERAPGAPNDRWWLDSFDGTWLPYAVTGGAVDYYLGRLRDLAAGRGPFVFTGSRPPDRGAFEYEATVRPSTEAGVARVVELRVRWEYWCGDECAVYFTHTRVVWFDANGNVLRVTGDGRPYVTVS